MKEKRKAMLQVQRTFKELLLYLIFLSVLYSVSFSNRDTRWFYFTQHLEQQLVQTAEAPGNTTIIGFDQITSASDLYTWLRETLTPFMFPRFATNGIKLNAYQRLYTADEVNLRVGPFRLRQLRTQEKSCIVNLLDDMQCFDEYSVLEEDDIDYCVGWKTGPCIRGQDVYNITSAAWRFVSSVHIWGLPSTGLYTTYGGGGYIMEFVVNYNISISILNDLYKYMWIDRQTRAVFIEFTLYNVDENVFVYVSFLCEFPETGGVITSKSVKPFRPYQHIGSLGVIIFVCELIVLVGITILAVFKVLYIYRNGRKIFKEFWNVVDVVIIVLFLLCTVMYIGRWIMINYAMEKFETNKNKFVNFSHIASWDELFNIILAFIIFLTTLRIMRILSYSPTMNQLGNVLRNVGRDLLGCFVMFLIVHTAFVMFGYLIFGRYLETYKNILVSSTTLLNAVIGKNSINDLFSVEPILGRFYYFLFVLLLLWILMTMLNATLNTGITCVRTGQMNVAPSYGITNLLLQMWKNATGSLFSTEHWSPLTKTVTSEVTNPDNILEKDVPTQMEVVWQEVPKTTCKKPRLVYQ